jgi:hypothetical protein
MKQLASILFALTILCAGCSSDGASTGLSVQAVTSTGSSADLAATDDGGDDFAIESAFLSLRDIELDLPDDATCADIADGLGGGATCDDSDNSAKIVVAGPFEVDLVAGTATPSLEDVQIPVGTYSRVDFRVEDNADDVSFAVLATFEHEGSPLSLDLSLDFNEDIRIEEAGGTTVDEDTDLIAQFVVDNWLAGVDIGGCIDDSGVEVDGTTVVVSDATTSGSCSAIEDTIKGNMKESGQFDKQ